MSEEGRCQHYVPVFMQERWLANGSKSVKYLRARKQGGLIKYEVASMRLKKSMSGNDLWTMSRFVSNPRIAETKSMKAIDGRASVEFNRIMTTKSLHGVDLATLSIFAASLHYRQPQIALGSNAIARAGVLQTIRDRKFRQEIADLGFSGPLRGRLGDGDVYLEDYARRGWVDLILDESLHNQHLSGDWRLVEIPESCEDIPLSDRPMVKATIGKSFTALMMPISPRLLIFVDCGQRRLREYNKQVETALIEGYRRQCVTQAYRTVVITCQSQAPSIIENFVPVEVFPISDPLRHLQNRTSEVIRRVSKGEDPTKTLELFLPMNRTIESDLAMTEA